MPVTVEVLERAEFRFRLEMEMVEKSRNARNHFVREAIADGWTHAQVAAVTGLSRARVGQIALNRR